MRIRSIQTHNLYFDYPNRKGYLYAGGQVTSRVTTIVEIQTDSGLTGWGATYAYPDLARIIIEDHLAPHLIGQDPRPVEAIWDKLYGLTRWYGRKGVAMSALGGIDIALWDLRGKIEGQPIWRLLGASEGRAPAYASALFWKDRPEELTDEALRLRERGFARFKTRLGKNWDYDTGVVREVSRAIAPWGRLLVDGSHRYELEAAIRFDEVLAEHDVFWFEEPFAPEEIDRYVALRPHLKTPLAAGENDFGVQGFREMIRAGALDVVQADACRAGGITECRRISSMAAEHGLKFAPHTWSDAVALLANAHLVAAAPHGLTVEVDQTRNPFIEKLLRDPLKLQDGILQLGDGPGLGAEVDREALERLSLPRGQSIPPGNYSDLIFGAEYSHEAPPYA
ncbi:MAG TPA: mandelate racemase/muconate lactonizing enzyme family protein [Candidatus Hydrogenedentes bacterium]|nr:mandelate racemase/muconate lactonizing enzyme family protein [Candidatus Hydrogenedentota bacterium]HIJ72933.1 mandelate racemase/muconate lactonizing enzyme family protein [Candidatus Hydrogenedentota bacterium]